MRIAVVGAGAAGLIAASMAGSGVVFEKNEKPGKKIYITGKGRCNLTNACEPEEFFQNIITNSRFMYKSFHAFSNMDLMYFIEKNGTKLKTERGNRVFPVSDHASDITKALLKSMEGKDIKFRYNTEVTEIYTESLPDGTAIVRGVKLSDGTKEDFDRVILACGGASYPGAGGTESGYKIAKKLGIKVREIRPSLVPLLLKEDYTNLAGLSLKNIKLKLNKNGKQIFQEFGELLFTHQGISGPLVLTASAKCSLDIAEGGVTGAIDLKPAIPDNELTERLLSIIKDNAKKQFKSFFAGLVPGSMQDILVELSGIDPLMKIGDIDKIKRKRIFELLRSFPLTVVSTAGFKEAVVTQGGIDVKSINPSTMECKNIKNLFICGEMLDVDALTGGFNLQCAFSTGYVAGVSAGSP